MGFVNSVRVICRGILLTQSRRNSPLGAGRRTGHGRFADQATSSVGGLIAVNADSAAPPERGRSTAATPAEAIGVVWASWPAKHDLPANPCGVRKFDRAAKSRDSEPPCRELHPASSPAGSLGY